MRIEARAKRVFLFGVLPCCEASNPERWPFQGWRERATHAEWDALSDNFLLPPILAARAWEICVMFLLLPPGFPNPGGS